MLTEIINAITVNTCSQKEHLFTQQIASKKEEHPMTAQLNYKPHVVREDFVDFMLEAINPMWAWKRVKAMVVDVKALSTDMTQLTLKPNHNFNMQAVQAGQSVLLTLVINGVRHQRSYSIVECTAQGIVLGIKAQGLVSKAAQRLVVGTYVEISQAQGDFVLHRGDDAAVLIASGSGITAIYSLAQQAISQKLKQVDVIYFTRDDVFHVELEALAQAHVNFNYHHINTTVTKQHLTQEFLTTLVPDFAVRQSYACGSSEMMRAVDLIYHNNQAAQNLHTEFFQPKVDLNLAAQPVFFQRSQQNFEADSTLLESAEKAGLRPSHGCRMGICNTCTCTKVSGTTKNILTGELDHGANTQIKLCVSQAVSPVVINL